MEAITAFFSFIQGLGVNVMMPILLTIFGTILGAGFGKSLKAGLTVGVGFIGLNLIINNVLGTSLAPAVQEMTTRFGLALNIIDVGWPASSAIAMGTTIGMFIIPLGLLVNILMLITNTTQTIDVDIWNYWHFAFTGSIVAIITGDVMLGFAALLLPYGLDYAAGGASLGAGAGGFAAWLVLVYYYYKLKRTLPVDGPTFEQESIKHILKRLVILAIPISLSSIMLPVVSNLDLLIVPRRLEVAGYSTHQATELFGYLTGMSVPLINLATILTAAMAMSLVPAISHSFTLKEYDEIRERTATSMRISFLVTIPFSVILYVMAEPIVTFIYNAPAATDATRAVAIAICFLGLHQISTAILQGLKKPKIPVINMAVACVAKVLCNWFLVAIPTLGITGASYATVADIGVAAVLNMFFIYRKIGYVIDIKVVMKNIVSAAIMGVAMYFMYAFLFPYLGLFLDLFLTCIVGSAIYIGCMVLNGGVTKEDAAKMPLIGRFF